MERTRLVIAERDSSFRKNLREMLTQAGYHVVGDAEDGMSALKLVRGMQPDLVLTAANLPGLDGLELARIIEEGRLCAVVVMVDYGERDLIKNGDRWTVPILVKPFDQFQLLSVLEYSYASFSKMVNLEQEINRLKNDLEARKIIERAKGILMKVHGLSEEAAFRRLQQQSMKKRTSMKRIAEAVIMAYEISNNKSINELG